MNLEELILKYYPLLRKNILFVGLFLLGFVLLSYGLISSLSSTVDNSGGVVFESAAPKITPKIFVDVEGSVIKPGVYGLLADSRIQDALISAGGLSSSADRAWVSKNINLSQKLADGMKIYIPIIGERAAQNISSQETVLDITDKININSASESELDSLPGIGPVTAGKIINNRPYATPEELVSKKAVSQKVFDNIKERIIAY